MVWVFLARYLLIRPGPTRPRASCPAGGYTFLLGWAGMRGVVTLAAAFVIPADAPYREVLLLIAFTVVAGTLFIQGLSLPWLARRLQVPAPDPLEDALARATVLQQASKAGFKRLKELEYDDRHGVFALLKQRIEQRNFAAWERLGTGADQEAPSELYTRVRLEMIEAERARVLEIRRSGQRRQRGGQRRAVDARRRGVDARHQPGEPRGAPGHRGPAPYRRTCDGPRRLPRGRDPPRIRSAATACARARPGSRSAQCLECGNIGCCDSSPRRHATAHFHEHQHPVMESAEPGEDWRWCYFHHATA